MQLIERKQCSKTQSNAMVLKSANNQELIANTIKSYLQMRKVEMQVDYMLIGCE